MNPVPRARCSFQWLPALLILVAFTSLPADTVYLRNGGHIVGKITNQTRTSVEIQTPSGTKLLQKKTIKRISYGTSEEERKAEEEHARAQTLALQRQREEETKQEAERKERAREARRNSAAFQKNLRQEAIIWSYMHGENRSDDSGQPESEEVAISSLPETHANWELLWRSSLLPGWGQYHAGKTTRGLMYGSSFAGSLALGLVASVQAYSYSKKYNSASESAYKNNLLSAPLLINASGSTVVALPMV